MYMKLKLLFLGIVMFTANQNNAKEAALLPIELTEKAKANPIKVGYTNYRGETAVRTIIPIKFYFGSTEYHPQEQWLLEVWDVERDAMRVYAAKDINQWFVE